MLNNFLKELKSNDGIRRISNILLSAPIFPKVIKRTDKAQTIVDKDCQKLRLYNLATCPFCIKVRLKIRELGLNIKLININEGNNRQELIEKGGKSQVPCLRVISKNPKEDKFIYESDVINRYLEENFKLITDI